MDRTACHHFVLPTPLSRHREVIQSRNFAPSSRGAKNNIPFNNAAERAMRCVAMGRKNWTFAGSDAGGQRAAAIYTLIETCKLNDVDPRAWLADVLKRLPDHPAKRINELLPWNWVPQIAMDRAAWSRPCPHVIRDPQGGLHRTLSTFTG